MAIGKAARPDFIEGVRGDARLAAARETGIDIARVPSEPVRPFPGVLRGDRTLPGAPGP